MTENEQETLAIDDLTPNQEKGRHRVVGCETCEGFGQYGPSHDPRKTCRMIRMGNAPRAHCSCAGCF